MSFIYYNNKRVYFSDKGKGRPLIIIHGNSVSSRMHKRLAKKLSSDYRVLSVDLPGHGSSERLEKWPVDFWYEHSKVIDKLIGHLSLENVVLLGYSGGALIALNAALEFPQHICSVIADSFEGEASVASFAENIHTDRSKDKKNVLAKLFWLAMHGLDWQNVVDKDTDMIYKHHQQFGKFFHKDLSDLEVPVFLTGSIEDEYIDNIADYYKPLEEKINRARMTIYKKGKHPASLTVGQKYIDDIKSFINDN